MRATGSSGRPLALVLGHTALAVPFVVINVSSTLYGVDRRLEYAALSLGASPWATFRQVTLPLIRPGIFAGAVFAFITSFDELLVALFLSGTTAVTLPRRMWEQIRFDIDPTLASVSTLLDHDHDQPDGRRRAFAPPVRAASHRSNWPIASADRFNRNSVKREDRMDEKIKQAL